jgi:hypothetical protein
MKGRLQIRKASILIHYNGYLVGSTGRKDAIVATVVSLVARLVRLVATAGRQLQHHGRNVNEGRDHDLHSR